MLMLVQAGSSRFQHPAGGRSICSVPRCALQAQTFCLRATVGLQSQQPQHTSELNQVAQYISARIRFHLAPDSTPFE